MNHVAIDLGGRESQVCVREANGTIVDEKKHPTRKLGEMMLGWLPSRVILETSAEAFRVADAAVAAGHEVRVVPATLVRARVTGDVQGSARVEIAAGDPADGGGGADGEARLVSELAPGNAYYNGHQRGAPARRRAANRSEVERWPELASYRGQPAYEPGPDLLWVRVEYAEHIARS